MCGPENTLRPRGGALAVLHPSQSHPGSPSRSFNADLFLHTPGKPDSPQATRAVLMPSLDTNMAGLDSLHLFVSTTGDLRQDIDKCKTLHHFKFRATKSASGATAFQAQFDDPMSLQVGSDGIIGRRVSLCSASGLSSEKIIAEGIVGHNFFSPDQLARHSQSPF